MPFTTPFPHYASPQDSITCEHEGFDCVASLAFDDDDAGAPDKNDDGFWPSQDPKAPGYIGDHSDLEFDRQMANAKAVLAAWWANKWFYCGVVVKVHKAGVLPGQASLWGVECNYPGTVNEYLLTVANEVLQEAMSETYDKLAALGVPVDKADKPIDRTAQID